jgi:hypothetical protein
MAKKLTPLEKEVARAFEEAYKSTGDWTEAYNKVLDEVGGKYSPDASVDKRRAVGDALRRVQKSVMLKLKDPFELAVWGAMKVLRRDKVVGEANASYRDYENAAEGGDVEGPFLYVMFNDDGSLNSWTVDHPDYWQGHGGPTAAVSLPTSWDSIESEIGETLAQAEIFEG